MVTVGRQRGSVWRGACFSLALMALAACASDVRRHGYVPPPDELAKIQVGVTSRDKVVETIGAPTSSGVLNEGGFYYVSTQVKEYGFRAEKIVGRQLVAISFDGRGIVSGVERYDLEDGIAVPIDRRITDSGANNQTFLRQLLGNLTNFNAGSFTQ